MIYGAIAASEITPVHVPEILAGNARFSGVGNFAIAETLSTHILDGSANFAGAGSLSAYLTQPEDAATAAWAAAVVSAGGTVSGPRKSLVNDLIIGLKDDGVWDKLDRLWIFAAENSQSALVDLVAAASASIVSTPVPTFTADRGYTGAGGGYISTGFDCSAGGHLYGQDDAHISGWSLTAAPPTGSTFYWWGAGLTAWLYYQNDGNWYFRVNDNGAATCDHNALASTGMFISSRSSSTERKLYQNGDLKYTTTTASTGIDVGNQTIIYQGTTGISFASYSIGGNLNSGSDAANFYTRLRTYMTAVGVP